MLFQMRTVIVVVMRSGLRRASIPSLKRAGLNRADAVKQERLDSEGRIDNTICMRDNAVAQNSIAIANTAGRIVAVRPGSGEPRSGPGPVFERLACRKADGVSVSKYSVGFGE